MKRLLPVVLLLIALAGPAGANEYIWLEGEDANSSTFHYDAWYGGSADKHLLSPGMPGGALGDWASHYIPSGNSPAYIQWNNVTVSEGGTYTWWVRLAPTNTSYTYFIDGGAAVALDTAHQHEVIDPARNVPLLDDVHYLSWVQVGNLNLTPGAHTIRINAVYNAAHGSTIGAVDCMCLINYPWTPTGALRPGGATNPDPAPGPGVWFPLHVGQDAFSADSIIDMQGLVGATTGIPAGVHGHLTRVEDHFELSGRPGTPVKFWGICANHPASTSLFDTQARFYAKHGINLLRRHPMVDELGQSPTSSAYDTYDRWFKALKDNGVYTDWSVFYPDSTALTRSFLPTPDAAFTALCTRAGVTPDNLWNELPDGGSAGTKKLGGMDCFVDWYQQGEWNWEQALLQHTNPYTGLQYVNDPALAIVEVQNEDSIFWWWPLSNLADPSGGSGTYYANHAKLLTRMWFEWLQQKYANDAALSAAWGAGKKANDSVETFHSDMTLYTPWHMGDDGVPYGPNDKPRMGDYIHFLADTQRAVFQRRFDHLTALGFQGVKVSTAWQAGGPTGEPANLYADDAGDAIDRHAYIGGGSSGFWYVSTGAFNNDIQLSAPGGMILGGKTISTTKGNTTLFQVEDKPAIVTEWDETMPTKWRAEMAPLFAFYGMGLQGWDASMHFAGSYPWMETGWPGPYFGPGPWVSETPVYMAQFPALAFAIYHGHIQQGDLAAARRINVSDLFTGVDPLSQALANGGYSGQDNVYTPPEVGAIGRVTFKADASLNSNQSVKSNWSNYWNQSTKVITSMTGQLVWDYANKVVQVKTPKTEALIGWSGGKGNYNLGSATVNVNAGTPFSSIIFTPLDDQPLTTSKHILVTALAQDTEAGASYSTDSNLAAIGGPPLYLQPVQATITLSGDPIADVRTVDVYGVPTNQTLSLAGSTFTISGDYTTYYYEINRSESPQPTIALSPTSLTPSCKEGSSPADDSFQVWDTGTASLNYTVSDDAGWLSVDPAGGTSDNDSDKQTHTVHYDASALSASQHTATITISDATATNDPQTIAVTLTIQPRPAFGLSTTSLSPACARTQDADPDDFQVWNTGGGTLSYTVSDDAAWLSVGPAGGSSTGTGDHETHAVTYTTSALAEGTYDATITLTDANASNSPAHIAVHLTVLGAPPAVSCDPASFAPTAVTGQDPPSESIDIWNGGEGTLSYTVHASVSGGISWLGVSPGSGSSADPAHKVSHTVTFSTAGLTPGSYNGSIVISAPGAVEPTVTLPVTLTVTSSYSIGADKASVSALCQPGSNPAADQVQVWNGASGSMAYTISDNAAWLTVTPGAGTSTGPGDVHAHAITYSAGNLAAGTYDATITVAAASASNTPLSIPVHLEVRDSSAPLVHIIYPREADSPLSDSLITVTGTASAANGVQAIWVNGVRALNTGTGFSTWQATIPLNQGFDASDPARVNTITASAVDSAGNYAASADSVVVDSIGGGGFIQQVALGLRATGAIVPGDVDTYQFEAAAGTALTLSLKGGGRPAPNLRLDLYDAFGQKVTTQTGASISIKLLLSKSGLYTARVLLAGGGGGQYSLSIAGKSPRASKNQSGNLVTASSEGEPLPLALLKGSVFQASAASPDFQPVIKLRDPIGHEVPMGAFLSASGLKAQVRNLPLPKGNEPYLTGDYTVCIESGNGAHGAFRLTCSAKAPKAAKQSLTFPVLLSTSGSQGVSRGGQLQLSVAGAADALAKDAVYLDGQRFIPTSASLKAGKGSLYVTVPADSVVGTVEVYFVRADSTIDEKSNSLEVRVNP